MHHLKKTAKASSQEKVLKNSSVLRRLLAATLSVSGAWQLLPLLALAQSAPLTAAGVVIDNTATGTYEDPNTPGVRINATSNKVTATVAEVAGVTVTSSGTIDVNGGSVTTGDAVNYSFIITNTGNDATALHIPTTATVTTTGGAVGGGTAGTNALPVGVAPLAGVSVYVTEVNGIVLTSPVLLPLNGNTTDTDFISRVNAQILGTANDLPSDGSIPIGGTIKVVVPVTITATIAGSPISVTLGNTGTYSGDVGTSTQNQPDLGVEPQTPPASPTDPASQTDEIYTINVQSGTPIRNAPPVNGVREASAKNTQVLATQINNLALATVLKTRTGYNTNATPTNFADDKLTYNLDLRVESSAPTGSTGITPSPLLPTEITLSGALANKILISDAIPANTTLDKNFGADQVDIGGVIWTRVYSTAATGDLITPGINPLAAGQNWIPTSAGTFSAATVTRIGYIADGPIVAGYSTVGAASALTVQVTTSGITASGGTINNIAQVFGQTTAGAISTTNPLVYDESGDKNPNNYENGSPSVPAITDRTNVPNGFADPVGNGTDTNTPGNNNTGTGPSGEVNVFTINPPGSILNGPQGAADAIGPKGNNTDFVNKSAAVPAGLAPGADYANTAVALRTVIFTNTVQNPSTNTAQLDNVTLEPITAAKALAALPGAIPALALTDFELASANNGAPLIVGTKVTIAYPVGAIPTGTGNTATYDLTTTGFSLISSTTNGGNDTTIKPVRINSLAIGIAQDYNVTVVLPDTAKVTTAYSVPIVAYVDSNTANTIAGENGFKRVATEDGPFNIKIDRVYTGYLQLLKQSRILQGTGPVVSVSDAAFSNAVTAKNPAPGNIIEYLLTYQNISTPASGSANVVLNANNIVVTEDGTASPNNWATTTLNVPSSAIVDKDGAGVTVLTYNAVITFFNGSTPLGTTDPAVTKYIDSIPTLTPSQIGYFRFQRQVK